MVVELLIADQVAKQLDCTRDYVWKLARLHKIDVIIIGNKRKFTQEAVDKFIKEHTLPSNEQ